MRCEPVTWDFTSGARLFASLNVHGQLASRTIDNPYLCEPVTCCAARHEAEWGTAAGKATGQAEARACPRSGGLEGIVSRKQIEAVLVHADAFLAGMLRQGAVQAAGNPQFKLPGIIF